MDDFEKQIGKRQVEKRTSGEISIFKAQAAEKRSGGKRIARKIRKARGSGVETWGAESFLKERVFRSITRLRAQVR